MKRSHKALALVSALMLAGCTFQPGVAFGTLENAMFTARFAPAASRLDPQGRLKTDTGYRIRIDSLQLVAQRLDVQSNSGGGGSSAVFDPANPPPRYSLCHGGHCHRDDGALVSYEEIEAELSGGTAAKTTVLSLPIEKPLNLLSGSATASLEANPPGQQLDRGKWSAATLRITSLTASGSVEDPSIFDRLGGQARTWSFSLSPEAFRDTLDVMIDRSEGDRLSIAADFALSERLFDAIDFEALAKSPGELVLDRHDEARRQLAENLSRSAFSVNVTR